MAKPEWGTKRQCQSCGAKYYDFHRTPIVCPACGATFDPEAILKARRPRPAPQPKKERVVPVADEELADAVADEAEETADEDVDEDLEVLGGEGEADVGDEEEVELDDEEDLDDDGLLEDTSELDEGDEDVEDLVEGDGDEEDR